jgi:hypothetical protein
MATESEIRNALAQVQDLELGRSIVDLEMVRDLRVTDGNQPVLSVQGSDRQQRETGGGSSGRSRGRRDQQGPLSIQCFCGRGADGSCKGSSVLAQYFLVVLDFEAKFMLRLLLRKPEEGLPKSFIVDCRGQICIELERSLLLFHRQCQCLLIVHF